MIPRAVAQIFAEADRLGPGAFLGTDTPPWEERGGVEVASQLEGRPLLFLLGSPWSAPVGPLGWTFALDVTPVGAAQAPTEARSVSSTGTEVYNPSDSLSSCPSHFYGHPVEYRIIRKVSETCGPRILSEPLEQPLPGAIFAFDFCLGAPGQGWTRR